VINVGAAATTLVAEEKARILQEHRLLAKP